MFTAFAMRQNSFLKSIYNAFFDAGRELAQAIKATPLFFWIYISVLVYVARKVTYRYGYGTKKIKVGDRIIYVDSAEEVIADGILDISKIDTDFKSVGGLEDVKKALTEHVKWPFTRPDLFKGKSLRSHPKGVLLYGPPGTGKTLLARALAKELGCTFINVKTESLFSKWIGDTEKNAAAVFTLAEKVAPCVIFVDEIDALLGVRNAVDAAPHNHAKTIFMTHWDGIAQSSQKLIVVGATNRPRCIDEAIRRRLPLQLEVPPPDKQTRREILKIILKEDLEGCNNADTIIQFIVGATDGFTGSDLMELCKSATLMPLREMKDDEVVPPLTIEHFSEALKRFKPSLAH